MGDQGKSDTSDGLQVTRVVHPFNAPRRTRNVDIKIEPCRTTNCTPQSHQSSSTQKSPASSKGIIYSILWAKATQRKNKVWEHDGFLIVDGNDLTLQDAQGKVLDSSKNHKIPDDFEGGTVIKMGGREVQIQDIVEDSVSISQQKEVIDQQKEDDYHNRVLKRKLSEDNLDSVDEKGENSTKSNQIVYSILWAKATQRKNKIWEHDGFLKVDGSDLTLQDGNGKVLDTSKNHKTPDNLEGGSVIKMGGREIQIQGILGSKQKEEEEVDDENSSPVLKKKRSGNNLDSEEDENLKDEIKPSPNQKMWSILWAKATQRKNKIWEHDGFLIVDGNDLTLQDLNGKVLDTSKNHKLLDNLEEGSVLKVGFREVQLQNLFENSSSDETKGPCILELMGKDDGNVLGTKDGDDDEN